RERRPAALPTAHRRLAAVRARDELHEVEPEAEAAPRLALLRLDRAELLEEDGLQLRRDAGARVAHLERHAPGLERYRDLDRRLRPRVLHRVREQVLDRPPRELPVERDRRVLSLDERDLDPPRPRRAP